MIINYDIEKINRTLQDFYNATGIEIGLLKPDFTPVSDRTPGNVRYCRAVQSTAAGKSACCHSDEQLLEKSRKSKKNEMAICHAGLLNVVVPLLYEDMIIGYIIFGRMRATEEALDISRLEGKAFAENPDLQKYYSEIPYFSGSKIESVSNIAIMLAKYILLQNMLKPTFASSVQRALEFINANLYEELSIAEISKKTNTSKSVLYKNFHVLFDCTVSEYIKMKRVEKSLELLLQSEMSIEEISQRVGFASASYYSRVFKAQMGVSPREYKKAQTARK